MPVRVPNTRVVNYQRISLHILNMHDVRVIWNAFNSVQ